MNLDHLPFAQRKQILIQVLSSDEVRNVTARFSRWLIPGTLLPPVLLGMAFGLFGFTSVGHIAIASILSCVIASLACTFLALLEHRAEARII